MTRISGLHVKLSTAMGNPNYPTKVPAFKQVEDSAKLLDLRAQVEQVEKALKQFQQ